MEALQKAIEPLQDAILKLAKLAAKLEGVPLQEANESLTDFRKSDKELRERLFVCQVAKSYGWEDANKMARRKAGDYEDPNLPKFWKKGRRSWRRPNAISLKQRRQGQQKGNTSQAPARPKEAGLIFNTGARYQTISIQVELLVLEAMETAPNRDPNSIVSSAAKPVTFSSSARTRKSNVHCFSLINIKTN